MSKNISQIRYQKQDPYGNSIFIADQKREPKAFTKLKRYYEKLLIKHPNVFLPIYSSETYNYSTLRVKSDRSYEKNATYAIAFTITQNQKDDKVFVNVNLQHTRLVAKAILVDVGTQIELSDNDESE